MSLQYNLDYTAAPYTVYAKSFHPSEINGIINAMFYKPDLYQSKKKDRNRNRKINELSE